MLGYIGEMVVDVIMLKAIVAVIMQLLLLFIFICIHIFTFTEIFASFVIEVDRSTDEENKTKIFRKLIRFHMDIKR